MPNLQFFRPRHQFILTAISFGTNASFTVIRMRQPRSSWKATTQSACRIKPSSALKQQWLSQTLARKAWNCTSLHNGYTKTGVKLLPASIFQRTMFALFSAESAVLLARAKISVCKFTAASLPYAQGGQSRCNTAERKASSGTYTAIPLPFGCDTTPTGVAKLSKLRREWFLTAAPTQAPHLRCSSMELRIRRAHTSATMP